MINKKLFYICLALFVVFNLTLSGQDNITDAFQDLKRTGVIAEEDSEMRQEASKADMDKLLAETPACNYFIFTEDRAHDIRMTDNLPQRWVNRPAVERTTFGGEAAPNEYYVFQLGVYAAYQDLENISIEYSDLNKTNGGHISKSDIECINLERKDDEGNIVVKGVSVGVGKIQALWVGIQIPDNAQGDYKGHLIIKPQNAKPQRIDLNISVKGNAVPNHGDNEGWRKSRLRWLNADSGIEAAPTAPYTALKVNRNTINYLGGNVELSETGLPKQIVTNYDKNNKLDKNAHNLLLADEISFIIESIDGKKEILSKGNLKFTQQNTDVVSWESKMHSTSFELLCKGKMSFDGKLEYSLVLKSLKDTKLKDIRLAVPYTANAAKYAMGLGRKGGFRADSLFNWNWDRSKHQDKIWMGNVNVGLNLCFKDETYRRSLVNIYYTLGRLHLPKSWGNEERGGVTIFAENKNLVQLQAYSGARDMKENEVLHYDVDMLITPVKPIDLASLATNRFYHSNSDLSSKYIPEAKKAGANFINIHHKKDIYPFINYPYSDESIDDLKKFIDESHENNIGVRLYYTTREVTVKIPELWALRSLGSEVIHDGPGKHARTIIHKSGPNEWLVKNLQSNFIPAWYNAFREGKYKGDMDISVITTPDSRWNNYYLAGLEWMVQNIGLSGIYIDDSALNSKTLQRARRILDKNKSKSLIDLHSWNHMNHMAGYANSLHLYMELLPYVDRIWIGEGFKAHNTNDFWLVEMSGIPFGMLSETLDAKDRFRGMVFGMLPRLPWSGDPTALWKLWDEFGMKDANIKGFWDDTCPVKTNNKNVYTTTFLKNDKALIAVANWTDETQQIKITIDEKSLGFKPSNISIPEIDNLQKGEASLSTLEFNMEGAKGLILLLEK